VPALKPAYLIHGDDHSRVGERRARLRALAEQGGGPLETAASAEEAVALLAAMTLATGWRVIIAEGAERYKDVDELCAAVAQIPPETTIAFFALEDGRTKAPPALHKAVHAAGGDVAAEVAVKEWDLPGWVIARAAELGLTLDNHAARALVAATGPRQARLQRELEKLAIELGPGARLDADAIHEAVARAGEQKAWTLADALVARDGARATRVFLQLRDQGERVESLGYWMTRRLREALAASLQLEAGTPPAKLRAGMRMPPKVAAAFLNDVGRTDSAALRRAVSALAALELDTHGGSPLDGDTLALRTIAQVTA
jgi:DNA polymerase-3 subunit delta